jgi:hypothetical protein
MRTNLTLSELDLECGELLPARETLSYGNANWSAINATNSSMALNVASYHASANSAAYQSISVYQG